MPYALCLMPYALCLMPYASSTHQDHGCIVILRTTPASFTTMIAIPASLTLLRLFLGPLALWLAFTDAPRSVYAVILVAGLLSDYFDGVLARRLGVAREWLRRLDSTVDVIFYIFLLLTA